MEKTAQINAGCLPELIPTQLPRADTDIIKQASIKNGIRSLQAQKPNAVCKPEEQFIKLRSMSTQAYAPTTQNNNNMKSSETCRSKSNGRKGA